MILSSREVEALTRASRERAVVRLIQPLQEDFEGAARYADLAPYIEDNKTTVAARADLDMTEARYVVGLGFMRDKRVRDLLNGPEFVALEAAPSRKVKLERLYRGVLRQFMS